MLDCSSGADSLSKAGSDTFVLGLARHASGVLLLLELRMNPSLKRRVSAEDVLQDVLIEALKSRHTFTDRGAGSLRAWLAAIAERRVARAFDQQARCGPDIALIHDASPSSDGVPEAVLADSITSACTAAIRNEGRRLLLEALQALTAEHREVILLRRVHEMPLTQVALRLNRTPSATAMLLQRALARLRTELELRGMASSTVNTVLEGHEHPAATL